jgi:HD-GYP domain-containing protein (c-di-GMP phosphodiesterase class II)
LLHDLGKIGVPDAILNKPGKLTDPEFKEMRLHPLHGARILSNIQSDRVVSVLPGVKYHHERWDGEGYPEGLKGEEIPLLGRVLGVADFLDALTSDRTYRKGLPLDEALQRVRERDGEALFNPAVVTDLHRQLTAPGELDRHVIETDGRNRGALLGEVISALESGAEPAVLPAAAWPSELTT